MSQEEVRCGRQEPILAGRRCPALGYRSLTLRRVIRGRDFVLLSSTQWDEVWEANHEIATRLAAAGNRVLYVEHMGFRAPSLTKIGRVVSYGARRVRSIGSHGVREVAERLWVCTPIVLPPFGSGLRRFVNRRLFLPLVDASRRRLGLRDPIIVSWVPTDSALRLVERMRGGRSLLVGYWVADYRHLVSDPERLRESEERLLGEADLVIVPTQPLADWCSRWSGNVVLLPHGVSASAFAGAGEEGDPPPELRSLRRPIVGYVGGLHSAVDYELLSEAIARTPDWSWVFVGPVRDPRASLPSAPNVHRLGWRPHEGINEYVRAFDVCIIPYREEESTEAVLPTKLYESLAAGRPVVSTRLPAVEAIRRQLPVFLTAEASPGPFVEAIATALAPGNGPAEELRRRRFAARSDWSVWMEELSELLLTAQARRADRGGRAAASG